MPQPEELDDFTLAYIEAALWSSTEAPFGICPQCGKEDRILCRWGEWISGNGNQCVCEDCSDRESNYEPPMDENYSSGDFAPETWTQIFDDCRKFQEECGELIANENLAHRSYPADERAGHDFWLTRNGHGAGFWDGDWEEPAATALTDAAHRFGQCDLHVGDDGRIYVC